MVPNPKIKEILVSAHEMSCAPSRVPLEKDSRKEQAGMARLISGYLKGHPMAKNTKVNSTGTEGKILEAQPTEAPANAPAPLAPVSKEKAKKNLTIQVTYQDKDGKEVQPGGDVVFVKTELKDGRTHTTDLTKLPKAMLIAAAAFGLNTRYRNAHNSTANKGGDGGDAFFSTATAIANGDWRSTGEGGDEGIPLVIEAMIRAKKDKGEYVEAMEEKWLTEYRSLDKDGKAKWTKAYSDKRPIAVALLTIKSERAMAKAAKLAGNDEVDTGEDF